MTSCAFRFVCDPLSVVSWWLCVTTSCAPALTRSSPTPLSWRVWIWSPSPPATTWYNPIQDVSYKILPAALINQPVKQVLKGVSLSTQPDYSHTCKHAHSVRVKHVGTCQKLLWNHRFWETLQCRSLYS